MFTKRAIKNIKEYGNVWGHTTEYDFKFQIRIWRRVFRFERRASTSFLGRHGGGWNVKIGIQAGSWRRLFLLINVIVSLGGTVLRIDQYEEKDL